MPDGTGYWAVLRHADLVAGRPGAEDVLRVARRGGARGPLTRDPGDDAGHAAGDGPAAPRRVPAQRRAAVRAAHHQPAGTARAHDLPGDHARRGRARRRRLRARRVRQAPVAGRRRARRHPRRGLAADPRLVRTQLRWPGPGLQLGLQRGRVERDDRDGDVRDRARAAAARRAARRPHDVDARDGARRRSR